MDEALQLQRSDIAYKMMPVQRTEMSREHAHPADRKVPFLLFGVLDLCVSLPLVKPDIWDL